MATQDSILKFKGQMGDLTFYKTKDGYGARKKGGIDANRLKTDPAFERTRENGAEFGKAGSASKVLRTALRTYLQNVKDSAMSNRLTREMVRIIRTDAVSQRGQRHVSAGDILLLKDFEFNETGKLTSTFHAPFSSVIDRVNGNLSVQIPAFVPANMIARPEGSTHMKLVMIAAEIDFVSGNYVVGAAESNLIQIGPQDEPVQTLTASVTPQSVNTLFLVFGVQFFQFVNGAQYPLRNGAFNALAIVNISRV
jgi:hypothetical protein